MEGGKDGGGSLRTVIPKGSLVTDRIESMAARNMIVKRKTSGGRRIVQGKKRNNKVRGAEGTEYLLI
jgi:nucleolar protein 53